MYLLYRPARGEGPEPVKLSTSPPVVITPGVPTLFNDRLGEILLAAAAPSQPGRVAKIVQCDIDGNEVFASPAPIPEPSPEEEPHHDESEVQ